MPNRFRPADRASVAGTLGLVCCVLVLAACRREPPPTERPPEPQAPAAHTELRDAIQAPQDKARAVEKTVHDAASRQQAQIDAEGG